MTSAQTSHFSHHCCALTIFHGKMWKKTDLEAPVTSMKQTYHTLSKTMVLCFCFSQGTSVVMDTGGEEWQELVARSDT